MPNVLGPDARKRTARLAEWASRQWGAITRKQLLALGYSSDEIRGMIARGFLIPVHRGIYIVGALSPAPEQRWAAAVLAGGRGAALMHTAAAANYELLPPREVIEVAVPKRRRGDATLRVHERRRVEITQHNGIPTTTIAQTLLDLAATSWPIDRMTQEAAARGLIAGQPLIRSRLEARALRQLGPARGERQDRRRRSRPALGRSRRRAGPRPDPRRQVGARA